MVGDWTSKMAMRKNIKDSYSMHFLAGVDIAVHPNKSILNIIQTILTNHQQGIIKSFYQIWELFVKCQGTHSHLA